MPNRALAFENKDAKVLPIWFCSNHCPNPEILRRVSIDVSLICFGTCVGIVGATVESGLVMEGYCSLSSSMISEENVLAVRNDFYVCQSHI